MNGLSFINDPWIRRRNQVLTFILIWKNVPFIRRCLDLNIVKKIAEYIKVDLSGEFKISETDKIIFLHVLFCSNELNYYGWYRFNNVKSLFYTNACNICLRPKCNIHNPHYIIDQVKDISKYREKFEFDNPIKEK